MNSILAFRPRKDASGKSTSRNETPATIIIFPGVRYERVSAETIDKGATAAAWMTRIPPQPLLTT